MLERLVGFLKELSAGADRPPRGERDEDPRIAAIALMFHLIDADGVRHRDERRMLERIAAESYDLDPAALRRLVSAAEDAEGEAVDFYAFTSVLNRHLDTEARREFVRAMWEIVYADGERNELEEHMVWRVAELIGVDSRERVELRREVEAELAAARGTAH
jgi:uncharacterized tellurite resistance protein B-like protein